MLNSNFKTSYINKLEKYSNSINPGIALLVIENSKIAFESTYGFACLEKKIRIDSKSNFRMASISKQFTGMALAMLEESEKLDQNKYITEYINNLPKYCEQIQVKHLIHHMSGLPDYSTTLCSTDKNKKKLTHDDICVFLKTKTSLDFIPGSKFEYSNTGYNLLGKLIENISETSYKDFIEKNIFKKAGMKNSMIISSPEFEIKNRVIGYSEWPMLDVNDYNSGNYLLGEDGVYSSLNDIYSWIIAIENNLLVSKETLNRIFSTTKNNAGDEINYGYGWFIEDYHDHKMYMHSGGWVGFNTMIVYFPCDKLWFVGLANSNGISSWKTLSPLINYYLGLKVSTEI
jgi:CubicO group peptidase (beta-lactamase class C family)